MVEHAMGMDARMSYKHSPPASTPPPSARRSASPKQARERYKEIRVGKFRLRSGNGKMGIGETEVRQVHLRPRYGEILGVYRRPPPHSSPRPSSRCETSTWSMK